MKSSKQIGSASAITAYLLWGLVPLFWKYLQHIPPIEVLAHRILWVAAFFVGVLVLERNLNSRSLRNFWRDLPPTFFAALFVGANWLIFIYAVVTNHVLEVSFGYFVNPLLNVFIGVIFFHERLSRKKWLAVGLACIGVALFARAGLKEVWISLSLASTFCFYSIFRKKVRLNLMTASLVEALLLAPFALVYLTFLPGRIGFQGTFSSNEILLILGGVATGLPLYFFVRAAYLIPLSTLGMFQYLAPILQFSLAVFVFREPFSTQQALGFTCIWLALLIFLSDSLRRRFQN